MARKQSAGLLMFRETAGALEVLLVHPGGPFWARRDEGAWSIPKGELEGSEDPLDAARREFEEETGTPAAQGECIALDPVRQPSGKIVHAFALRGDFEVSALKSNRFSLEWPPKSGQRQEFPEVDRAEWLSIEAAKRKIIKGQLPFITQLEGHLAHRPRVDEAQRPDVK